MNYRHIFHAGNFGDVFKHALLVPLVGAMQRKEKGFLFLDTHAGAGAYDLKESRAGRTREFAGGIGRLWRAPNPPPALRTYLSLVRSCNESQGSGPGELRHYPGSPKIAQALLRPQDRLALSELHPEEFTELQRAFHRTPRVSVQRLDAYAALRAHLPPPERRAFVLIDPPYEDANEVSRLHAGLEQGLQRLPAGTFAIWYPIKVQSAAEAFRAVLLTLSLPPTLDLEITVRPADTPDRLNGCGLIVINPPWQIAPALQAVLAALEGVLRGADGAGAKDGAGGSGLADAKDGYRQATDPTKEKDGASAASTRMEWLVPES